MSKLDEYQEFVASSRIHHKAIEAMITPLVDAAFEDENDAQHDSCHLVRTTLSLNYSTLGLVGEAGEFAEKVKKAMRDGTGNGNNPGVVSEERREAMVKELGDVLWYLTDVGAALGVTLEQIMEANMTKLKARIANKTRHGDGDDR